MALSVHVVLLAAAVSSAHRLHRGGAPDRGYLRPIASHSVRCCAEPPLEERQAAIMRAQGYSWDADRSRWFRGDPATRERRAAECRSGTRVARWVNPDGSLAQCDEPVHSATQRLETLLQDARESALDVSDQTRAFELEIKDKLMDPLASVYWAAAQVAIGILLLYQLDAIEASRLAYASLDASLDASLVGASVAPSVSLVLEAPLTEVALGVLIALPLTLTHRHLRRCHTAAGTEADVGQLERVLADGALGSHALPAPWEWRGRSTPWRCFACALELLATSNALVALHGVAQPAIATALATALPSSLATALALLTSALLPAARELYFVGDPLVDGLPAELEAAARAARTADAFFLMSGASEATSAEEAAAAAAALRALATGWSERFGDGASAARPWRAAAAAAAFSALVGTAALAGGALEWGAGGGSPLLAPLVANACATVDAYLWSCDPEASTARVCLTCHLDETQRDESAISSERTTVR